MSVAAVACGPAAGAQATKLYFRVVGQNAELVPAARTWRWQNPLPQGNGLGSVSFATDSVGWAVGGSGTILKTADGGESWAAQTSGTDKGLSRVTAVSSAV